MLVWPLPNPALTTSLSLSLCPTTKVLLNLNPSCIHIGFRHMQRCTNSKQHKYAEQIINFLLCAGSWVLYSLFGFQFFFFFLAYQCWYLVLIVFNCFCGWRQHKGVAPNQRSWSSKGSKLGVYTKEMNYNSQHNQEAFWRKKLSFP
jgi:hypothetical protein